MDRYDFIQTWIALEAGAALGKERLRAFYTEAGRRGINLAARGLEMPQQYPETSFRDIMDKGRVAAKPQRSLLRRGATRLAMRSPYIAAGYAIGKTAAELEVDHALNLMGWFEKKATGGTVQTQARGRTVKKKLSKFNKAVKAGMSALKRSTSYGKKNTINNPKKAFGAVTKVASKINKGKKVSVKGVTGTIARAVRKIL